MIILFLSLELWRAAGNGCGTLIAAEKHRTWFCER
jgi:hypothetical protein